MSYSVSITNQSDISQSTYSIPILRIESYDIDNHSLRMMSGGELYYPLDNYSYDLKGKICIAKKTSHELSQRYKKHKETYRLDPKIEGFISFIDYYIWHCKAILSRKTTKSNTACSFNSFILTRHGKLLLGLAKAINMMLYLLENDPKYIGEAKWGTKAGVVYLISKTREYGAFSIDEFDFVENEVTKLLQGWEYE